MLAVDVVHLLAAEGTYSASVNEQLDRSDVWRAYSTQKHDLFLPAGSSAQVLHPSTVAQRPRHSLLLLINDCPWQTGHHLTFIS